MPAGQNCCVGTGPADFGANQWLVDELYQRYLADPGSVDRAWWSFFADYQPTRPNSASPSTTEAEIRVQADSRVYLAEKFLAENQDKLPADVKAGVLDSLAELNTALNSDDTAAIQAASEIVARAGRSLSFEGASGVQVGDHNVQHNYYFYGQQTTGPAAPRGDRLPYRGLAPFEEADHEFFFGRDDAIGEVMQRLAATRSGIVVVSGASGVGKSSLLRAGILPSLRPCLLFTPGAKPLDELAAQMAVLAGISVEEARRPLATNPQLFGRLVRQAVLAQARQHPDQASQDPSARQRLVLIIDQFEHLFTLCDNEGERRAFITALESAASAPEPSVLVVLGVRANYERRCAEYPQLADAVRDRYLLDSMSDRDLKLAITQPARRAGASVEPELVERLLTEARDSTGALPWVSQALMRIWPTRTAEVLTVADYDVIGGIELELAAHALGAYHVLTERQRDTARQMFLRLTATGDDGGDHAVPVTWDDVHASLTSLEVEGILNIFAAERIVTLTGEGVEISHTALLTAWPLLRDDWLADRRRREHAAGATMRVLIDIEERQGELFLIITDPDGLHTERPVRWAGSPGRRLLVAGEAGAVTARSMERDEVEVAQRFAHDLVMLHQLAGEPSYSILERASGHELKRATVSDVLNGKRAGVPGWQFVASFVVACRKVAEQAGLDPDRIGTVDDWKRRWDAAKSASAGSPPPEQAAGMVSASAALADAVDQGHATRAELTQYGQLLFEAAFGQELWWRLLRAATGRPYLELAIRGADGDDQVALQALRWEALHDGTGPLAAQGVHEGSPPISVVRIVSDTGLPEGAALRAEFQPVRRLPRVLFAIGSRLDDPAVRAEKEIADVVRQLDQGGVSVDIRVLEWATLPAIHRELEAFKPDILHLISHGRLFPDWQTGVLLRADLEGEPPEEWFTAGQLVDAFQEAGHGLRMLVLSACETASSPKPQTTSIDRVHAEVPPSAARIVAGGVPVVVAMAGDIGDPERRAFAGTLAASVLQGVPLAEAIITGRQAASRDSGPGSTHWTLPTVFIAEHVRTDLPIVDTEVSRAVRERIDALGLHQDPVPFVRSEFVEAMDRLLDGSDPLNVLVAYAPDQDRGSDEMRLLRELGAHAVRAGVLPVLLGPLGTPSSLFRLAEELNTVIRDIRAALDLPEGTTRIHAEVFHSDAVTFDSTATLDDLVQAVHAEFDRLVADLPESDPARTRAALEPKIVLLCYRADEWAGAPDGLLYTLGPSGLRTYQPPVPVVLTRSELGRLRDPRSSPWSNQAWITAIALDRLPVGSEPTGEADEIRALVAAGNYQQADELLTRFATIHPDEAEHLRLELGFITLPDPDRRLVATAWSAIAAGRTVQSLLADDTSPPDSGPETFDAAVAPLSGVAPIQPQTPKTTMPRRSPQQSGAALEQATVDLFARFFAVDPDAILGRLRRQGAGVQFGHDIELECTVAGSPAVRCHVECKSLDRRVTVDDIAGKLAQQKYHHRGTQIDHWILISPHHDGANELSGMLKTWDQQREYPFSVQVWSPETRVREMFALEPAVYAAVYGLPPTQDEISASGEIAELIKQRLAPRLRVDAVWRRYLEQPGGFCFVNEDSQQFDGLYGRHLPLQAADERGALLGGTLMDQVASWAGHGGPAPMLLLADFGEGKSVFTYCLTRRLCEEFRAAPDGALFPLRIPLREFREAGSARGLLVRRLNEIGATLADWRALTKQVRTLAILDGFDEMSADLSPAAITANLKEIRSCLTELSGSKVLVTSRQRVLDGSRDWKRTLDRLGQPQITRIASGPRRQRVQYLEQFATDEASARVLANLRSLYDPIGLAAKPLFLEMIKETLRDLPDDTFSETILYDTYINKSLRTKWELLADPSEDLTSDELIENLKEILEDVAVRLQENNGSYLYLRDYQAKDRGKIAELLWKMRDQAVPRDPFSLAAQDDAANRVGIRSLLKAVPAPHPDRWPVDFFHRSMREYFVARAIARSLTTDAEQARQVLSAAPLLPEIAHFAATILRSRLDDAASTALERLARSATIDCDDAYLGGNALTLLHGAGGGLAERDWSRLRLDHARLRGADLHGARLAGSSLQYANLDNANLEDADLSGADLEGVRLEETSQVLAVAALDGNRIIATYEDRSLREWRTRPGSTWESQVIATLGHKADQLQVTPLGRLLASGEGMLSVLDVAGDADGPGEVSSVRCAFRTSSRCRAVILGTRTALFAEEKDGGQIRVTWLDTTTAQALYELDLGETITAWTHLDETLLALATSTAIVVTWLRRKGRRKTVFVADTGITCMAVRANGEGALLAAGHHDGSVSLAQLSLADGDVVAPQWTRHLHDGPVTGIFLDAEEQLITGSTDRTVCVTPVSAIRSESPTSNMAESAVQRLHLTLRCQGVRFDGVRTDREREKLRGYAESAPSRVTALP